MSSDFRLRRARPDEIERIRHIEDDAGLRYAAVGLDGDEPGLTPAEIEAAIDANLLLVAVDADNEPMAFALCRQVDGVLHLHELDVVRAQQGRGVGSALLDAVGTLAGNRGCAWVSLITYRDVPFNGPFYAKRGFVEWPPGPHPGWITELRAKEIARGLDAQPRVVMRRDLGLPQGDAVSK